MSTVTTIDRRAVLDALLARVPENCPCPYPTFAREVVTRGLEVVRVKYRHSWDSCVWTGMPA